MVQDKTMLGMDDAKLKAAGFDGAFIALGRTCVYHHLKRGRSLSQNCSERRKGFKKELRRYTEDELRMHCAEVDARTKSKSQVSEGEP